MIDTIVMYIKCYQSFVLMRMVFFVWMSVAMVHPVVYNSDFSNDK